MQKILGYLRKAVHEFDLLQDGDVVAVGVSGGKDSLVLLQGLALLRRFIGIDYTLKAITLDPGFGGVRTDYSKVAQMCRDLGVEYIQKDTDIGTIVFDIRHEPHPCSLCAKMRRGALHDTAKEYGCNKVALGHHFDDVVETFLMNLFIEGRLGCFAPKNYLSIKDLWVIRPLVFAPEAQVRRVANKLELPVTKSRCPVDGHTKREEMTLWLAQQEREDHGFKLRMFGALRRSGLDGWGYRTVSKKGDNTRELAKDFVKANSSQKNGKKFLENS